MMIKMNVWIKNSDAYSTFVIHIQINIQRKIDIRLIRINNFYS